MALNPQLYYADLAAMRSAAPFPFLGFSFDQMAWAIATAMVAWGPTVVLRGVCAGTAGAGAISSPTTKMFLPPNPPLVIAGLAEAGMVGPLGISIGTVVGLALPKTISVAGNYVGGVLGVGAGTDLSKVTQADAATLASILLPLCMTFLGPGSGAPQLSQGLSLGISKLVLTTTGAGTVVGPTSIIPGAGSSTSVMV